MRTRRTAALLTLAVMVPFGALAGCGGGNGADDSAHAVLKETFGPGHPIKSGRIGLSLRVTGSGAGFNDPIDVALSGPFVNVGPNTIPRFALQAKIGGDQVAAGLVSTGKQGFLTVGGQAFVLSAKSYADLQQRYTKTQQEDRAKRKDAPGLSALGVHPAGWLTDATTSTDADVGGTPTTRVSGALDVDALLADIDRVLAQSGAVTGATATTAKLPKRLTPAVKQALNRSVTTAKVSVDSGRSDRTLRRITLRLIMDVAADDQKLLGGLKSLDVDLDFAITDLGKVQQIATPKNARPVSELGQALSSLTPGSSTTPQSTATTPQTTTTAPPASGGGSAQQQYTDCLTKAGSDVAAIQDCAGLINR